MKNKNAFSLIEITLVVAIIGIVLSISLPAFSQLFFRNSLDTAIEKTKTELYRAQNFARASKNDTNWGVYLEDDRIILFSGNSYSSRNSSLDEIEYLSGQLEINGLNEIVFSKSNGFTTNSGEIIISSRGMDKNININSKSLIY